MLKECITAELKLGDVVILNQFGGITDFHLVIDTSFGFDYYQVTFLSYKEIYKATLRRDAYFDVIR